GFQAAVSDNHPYLSMVIKDGKLKYSSDYVYDPIDTHYNYYRPFTYNEATSRTEVFIKHFNVIKNP
ncbi:MAG: hypothetical protein AB7P49_11990, partial [Bdellovibrionales bacterium]